MRAFYRQLDTKSLVIGILISAVVLLLLAGVKGRAQVRSAPNIPRYQMAVGEDGPYVLDTTTGLVTRPPLVLRNPAAIAATFPPKYQVIAGDGGVYILNERLGQAGYYSKQECSRNSGCGWNR